MKLYFNLLLNKLRSNDLFKDSSWALFGNVVGKGLSLVAGIVVARFLGKDLFGEFGTIKNTLTYIAIVSTFGFGYSATKFVAEYNKDNQGRLTSLVKKIVLITLVFSGLLAILQTIFAKEISVFIKAPEIEHILRYYSPLIIFNALVTTDIAVLSGFKSFKEIAKNSCIAGISLFVLSVLFTYLWGLEGAVGAMLASFVIQYIFNQFSIKKELKKITAECNIENKEVKDLLSFSLPIALQESLYTVVHWILLWILIEFSNYGEVGLSSAAATWQSIVIFIPGVLKNVMFSHLTVSENRVQLVKRLLLINVVSTILPILIILLFSNFICSFYGPTFIGLNKVLLVSLSSSLFICTSEVFCYEFIASGHPWIVFCSRMLRDGLIIIAAYFVIRSVSADYAYWQNLVMLFGNILYLLILFGVYNHKVKRMQS